MDRSYLLNQMSGAVVTLVCDDGIYDVTLNYLRNQTDVPAEVMAADIRNSIIVWEINQQRWMNIDVDTVRDCRLKHV